MQWYGRTCKLCLKFVTKSSKRKELPSSSSPDYLTDAEHWRSTWWLPMPWHWPGTKASATSIQILCGFFFSNWVKFIQILAFSIISWHCDVTGNCSCSSSNSRNHSSCPSYTINTIAADDLAPCITTASAAMVLTLLTHWSYVFLALSHQYNMIRLVSLSSKINGF